MLLVVIPVLLIVSFVFYTIATIDGAVFGTPEGEIDSIIESKMKDIVDEVEKDAGGADIGDKKSNNIGNSLDKVQFGLKMVPNLGQHKYLLQEMQLVGG